jgi:hypothetical protein
VEHTRAGRVRDLDLGLRRGGRGRRGSPVRPVTSSLRRSLLGSEITDSGAGDDPAGTLLLHPTSRLVLGYSSSCLTMTIRFINPADDLVISRPSQFPWMHLLAAN